MEHRADQLRAELARWTNEQSTAIWQQTWAGHANLRDDELDRIGLLNKRLAHQIAAAERLADHFPDHPEPAQALSALQLDIVQAILREPTNAQIRLAKLEKFEGVIETQRNALAGLSDDDVGYVAGKTSQFIGGLDAVARFLRDLAEKPQDFAELAISIASGEPGSGIKATLANTGARIVKWIASKAGISIPEKTSPLEFKKLLQTKGLTDEVLQAWASRMTIAVEILDGALMAFQVVTSFFSELAKTHSWGNAIGKTAAMSVVSAGFIIADAEIVSLVTTTIESALAAAGSTAEVPPIAAVIVAAGLVIIGTAIAVELYDYFIPLIFGRFDMAPSIYISIHARTSAATDQPMSADMSSPMSGH